MDGISALNPKLLIASHLGEGNMGPARRSFEERVTRWHELDIITWGDGVDHVMGTSWPVTGGDVFYRVPGLRNRHELPYHCYFFAFDPYYDPSHEALYALPRTDRGDDGAEEIWAPAQPLDFAAQPYLGKARDLERLVWLARRLLVEFTRTRSDPLQVKILLLQLLQEVSVQFRHGEEEQHLSVEKYRCYSQSVWEIQNWVRSHPTARNSMEEMAARLHVSYSFFSRMFKAVTGSSYAAFVAQTRLDSAKLSLLETNLSVAEIAQACGYSDPNYLYLAFRRMMGCTPGEYRAMMAYPPEMRKNRT